MADNLIQVLEGLNEIASSGAAAKPAKEPEKSYVSGMILTVVMLGVVLSTWDPGSARIRGFGRRNLRDLSGCRACL